MRIAYLLESGELFGGAKVILMHAEALAARGHDVTVVCPGTTPDWFPLKKSRLEQAPFATSRALVKADVRVATFFRPVRPALDHSRVPVFHLCQGYEGEIAFYNGYRDEIEQIYRLPTYKLAVSQVLADRLISKGFGPVADVGQAFDATEFSPGAARPPADPPVVIVVGPVEIEFKGVAIALDGLEIFRARGGRFHLRRVSYFAPGEDDSRFMVADEFHHFVAPEKMPLMYQTADAFVGASRIEEGFGLPTLEAMACGLPLLLSDVPGQKEIGGNTAQYFRDGNAESLADGMPQLLSAEARAQARVAGPARAARYSTARVAERLEFLFQKALGTSR
jgi:glycosyltransferase involved in cell wall biosynthesis